MFLDAKKDRDTKERTQPFPKITIPTLLIWVSFSLPLAVCIPVRPLLGQAAHFCIQSVAIIQAFTPDVPISSCANVPWLSYPEKRFALPVSLSFFAGLFVLWVFVT